MRHALGMQNEIEATCKREVWNKWYCGSQYRPNVCCPCQMGIYPHMCLWPESSHPRCDHHLFLLAHISSLSWRTIHIPVTDISNPTHFVLIDINPASRWFSSILSPTSINLLCLTHCSFPQLIYSTPCLTTGLSPPAHHRLPRTVSHNPINRDTSLLDSINTSSLISSAPLLLYTSLFCAKTSIAMADSASEMDMNPVSISRSNTHLISVQIDWCASDINEENMKVLRERYRCPHFRILVIGRANAGKTTILEKVCGVAKGTKPIIYDKDGKPIQNSCMLHSYSVLRYSIATFWDPFDVINWSESGWIYIYLIYNFFSREACMILSTRSHTMEVTLSFMTLRGLNLDQPKSWKLLGTSLNRGLPKLS